MLKDINEADQKTIMIFIIFITFLIVFASSNDIFLGETSENIQSQGMKYLIFVIIIAYIIYKFYDSGGFKNNKNQISRLFYYFIVIYIFHILWVILTFTNPDKLSCAMISNRVGTCKAKGLYFGKYPEPKNDYQHSYHDYIFDISTWFPPEFLPDDTSGYKCAACPYNKTATTIAGCNAEGNILCRE